MIDQSTGKSMAIGKDGNFSCTNPEPYSACFHNF
jgi:hypothetical protein